MRTLALAAASLTFGCASTGLEVSSADTRDAASTRSSGHAGHGAELHAAAGGPSPGDYTVRRVSGARHASPLVLTERYLGRDGDAMVFELEVEEGARRDHLRLRTLGAGGKVLSVTRVDERGETRVSRGVYDRLMSRISFVADDNEESLGSESLTCLVAGEERSCTRTSYTVRIGGKRARLSVVTADGVDVEGEVTADDGEVLHRSRLVEVGNDAETGAAAQR